MLKKDFIVILTEPRLRKFCNFLAAKTFLKSLNLFYFNMEPRLKFFQNCSFNMGPRLNELRVIFNNIKSYYVVFINCHKRGINPMQLGRAVISTGLSQLTTWDCR